MVEDHDRGFRAFMDRMHQAGKESGYVKVGVLEGSERKEGGYTNAQVAAVHEYGSGDGRVPQRAFLRSTIDANRPKYLALMEKAAANVLSGKTTLPKLLAAVGLIAVTDVKRKIVRGPFLALAPSTVARKGSSRPLVDTGQLLNSIASRVVLTGQSGAQGQAQPEAAQEAA